MRTQKILILVLPLMIVLSCFIHSNESRGGRRGGGGIFGVWRKSKKPYSSGSSSSSSSRRTQGQKYDVPYTPLKSVKSSKTQMSATNYPRQELPPGASYHPSGTSFPTGAMYHGVAVPPGGVYYANAAAIPPGAIYFAQPPTQSTFSPGNFLLGMYAGQVMSHGLFGHRSYVKHIYHDNQQQQLQNNQDANSDKVVIIENGGRLAAGDSSAIANRQWPMGTDVPLAPFNNASSTDELLHTSKESTFETSVSDQTSGGIICVPHTLSASNQTAEGDSDAQQVPKIICYPAANNGTNNYNQSTVTIQAQQQSDAPSGGIICIPQISLETDPNDPSKTIKVETKVCYPALAVPQNQQYQDESTKSPDSVIGNIPNPEEFVSVGVTAKQEA